MDDSPICYVSGPLHSGKTTRLHQWAEGRPGVAGVSQPVLEGRRYFVDIRSGQKRPMEADANDVETYTIGKYTFAIDAFRWAGEVLADALEDPGVQYLIVDEVGPVEMRGQGLDPVLEQLLESPIPGVCIVLVIREHLLDEVLERYKVREFAVPFGYPG